MIPALEFPIETVLGVERSVLGAHWQWRSSDERAVLTLAQKLGIPDVLARILVGRGITHETAEVYLSPSLKATLPEPCHLKDMEKAVTRLVEAVTRGETIGVFGDYDVDGATSSALLLRYFREIGVPTLCHIPDRIREGYGPNAPALLDMKARGAGVVITVDCGAVAFEPLGKAQAGGLDVIVVDHHMGAAQLPEAVAVVNPNRFDETSPCRHLAAVGVCFLLLVALNRALRLAGRFASRPTPDLLQSLDLVALGTVCDVMPLTGLNRAFVRQGLSVLGQRRNPGLNALLAAARLDEALSTYHLGFILGPRINAGGRVGEADLGVRLLATDDADEAAALAARLDAYNGERQAIEKVVLAAALAQAEAQVEAGRRVLLVASEGWHPGVIGIVAGRLKERFHRPVAVVALDGATGKASARAIPGSDFGGAVQAARMLGLLLSGGGHAMAAGFTAEADRLSALHDFLESRLMPAHAPAGARVLKLDACLHLSALSPALIDSLAHAAPYGTGNAHPRFALGDCRVLATDIVKEAHIRLHLCPAAGTAGGGRLTAMAFRAVATPLGDLLLASRGKALHVAGQLRKDVWQGNERLSFHIEDAHPA